jgi:DNA-binding NarL/FixJ family response regulator
LAYPPLPRRVGAAAKAALTPRETEVLKLVAAGLTNKEIANRLDLSSSSVETYRARALTKLSLTSRADIVRYAATRGWSSV